MVSSSWWPHSACSRASPTASRPGPVAAPDRRPGDLADSQYSSPSALDLAHPWGVRRAAELALPRAALAVLGVGRSARDLPLALAGDARDVRPPVEGHAAGGWIGARPDPGARLVRGALARALAGPARDVRRDPRGGGAAPARDPTLGHEQRTILAPRLGAHPDCDRLG